MKNYTFFPDSDRRKVTLLVVLRHFMVEKIPQSRSRQENYVDALKVARTLVNS